MGDHGTGSLMRASPSSPRTGFTLRHGACDLAGPVLAGALDFGRADKVGFVIRRCIACVSYNMTFILPRRISGPQARSPRCRRAIQVTTVKLRSHDFLGGYAVVHIM